MTAEELGFKHPVLLLYPLVPRVVARPRVTGLLVAGLLEACGIMGRELTQLDGARLEEGALWASYSLVVWMSWPRMRWWPRSVRG